ncbi:MAG: hypothetical protein FK734_05700 [Asgard group archaeon]|nr:hypothetical protein [Asgard group archaeon]
MFVSNPLAYVNIISGLITIIVSLLILNKDVKEPINIYFTSTFFFWGMTWVLNGLNFAYKHPIIGAQAIRDAVTTCSAVAALFIILTGIAVYFGPHYLRKWYIIVPILVITIAVIVIGIIFDGVVYDNDLGTLDTGTGIKTTQEPWVMIFIYGYPMVMIATAIYYFIRSSFKVDEEIIKRRIMFFILGFTFIICGSLVYFIGGLVEQLFSFANESLELIVFIIAELFWAIAPILPLIGFYLGKPVRKKRISDEIF